MLHVLGGPQFRGNLERKPLLRIGYHPAIVSGGHELSWFFHCAHQLWKKFEGVRLHWPDERGTGPLARITRNLAVHVRSGVNRWLRYGKYD